MKKIKDILLYIWQIIQNITGLICVYIWNHKTVNGKPNLLRKFKYKGKTVHIYESFPSGVSLGNYILLDFYREYWNINKEWVRMNLKDSVQHEHGHCRQSEFLGPFYLPIIGSNSGGFNLIDRLAKKFKWKIMYYYDWWPEKWADKLGGVKRKRP